MRLNERIGAPWIALSFFSKYLAKPGKILFGATAISTSRASTLHLYSIGLATSHATAASLGCKEGLFSAIAFP
jgi:hypothetical protein